jgi:MFS family permease
MAPRGDILVVLVLIGWAGVDMSVCLPSMYVYIRSLGGGQEIYGLAGALASGAQFFASPIFGWLADRHSDKSVILASLLAQLLGGALYALAPQFPHHRTMTTTRDGSAGGELLASSSGDGGSGGDGGGDGSMFAAYAVVAARAILGFAAGNGASCRAYLARNSPPEQATQNLGLAAAAWRIGLVTGPAINWLLLRLPVGRPWGLRLDSLTWVGYFIALSSLISGMLVAATLRPTPPPELRPRQAGGLAADHAAEEAAAGLGHDVHRLGACSIPAQLWRSNAWVMMYIGMINNFAVAVLQFSLPLYCLRHYGFNQASTHALLLSRLSRPSKQLGQLENVSFRLRNVSFVHCCR